MGSCEDKKPLLGDERVALGLLEKGLSFRGEGAKRSGFGEMERSKRLIGRGGILGRDEVFVSSSLS